MAKGPAHEAWKVLEHGALAELGPELWRVEGALPGMALRRQMIVARARDGRLLVHNALALREEVQRELEALGEPTWLVVPNGWHRLDAKAYLARYPRLHVLCPRGSRAKVEQVVAVSATYDEAELPDGLALEHLRGVAEVEGVLRVSTREGTTLVFNDVIFNQPHLPGLFGLVYRLLGQSGAPKVTLISRLWMVKDRRALAAHLEELAATPELVRVIPAHIEPITPDPAAVLRALAASLR